MLTGLCNSHCVRTTNYLINLFCFPFVYKMHLPSLLLHYTKNRKTHLRCFYIQQLRCSTKITACRNCAFRILIAKFDARTLIFFRFSNPEHLKHSERKVNAFPLGRWPKSYGIRWFYLVGVLGFTWMQNANAGDFLKMHLDIFKFCWFYVI